MKKKKKKKRHEDEKEKEKIEEEDERERERGTQAIVHGLESCWNHLIELVIVILPS